MKKYILLLILFSCVLSKQAAAQSWTADNGNGTYTNPLFYDEVSDPDIIRVGDDFYLVSTTMHTMPGLPVMHSKDLVNWKLLGYAFDRLDMGEEFQLVNGQEAYGQGIWAPCIRYHDGVFYIFSNINNHGMQVFMAENPAGPWTHKKMGGHIYDLSVLFDDDGKIYAVYGYDEVKVIEVKPDMSGYVEGSERVIIPRGNAMGEGHHIYKIDGKYYIISANFSPTGRMQCARADKIDGPYQTAVISTKETFGTERAWWVNDVGLGIPLPTMGSRFKIGKPAENDLGAVPMHQGGIVDLPNGEWWGFSMIDFHAVGRTTCISPVTWMDGWPMFGLPENPGRSPRTWFKPNVAAHTVPETPFVRSDNFNSKTLLPVWQWNHEPNDKKWQLDHKKGVLRLHTLPAKDFLWARNTLTQRGVGPESYATVTLDASKLKAGDIAGLGLLNIPYAWIGVACGANKEYTLCWYNLATNTGIEEPLRQSKVYLRAFGNFDTDIAQLSYSTDGLHFKNIGDSIRLPYQLKTFQGTRYALFAYSTLGKEGGYAEFDDFVMDEPLANRSANLPLGKIITLTNLADNQRLWANPHGMLHTAQAGSERYDSNQCRFRVHDRGQGRVALEAMDGSGFITITGTGLCADVRILKEETENSLFVWQDMLRGQCMLLSLKTKRFVGRDARTNESYSADWPGTIPNRKDGTVFAWKEIID